MIELQRDRMGLPMNPTSNPITITSSQQQNIAVNQTKSNNSPVPPATNLTTTSHERRTIIKLLAKDRKICRFLHKLKKTKPTVPPSLTRRILHKQGVGYADPLVSTIVSSAADRFLATVLSQALVCRDLRFKGESMARKRRREIIRSQRRRMAERKCKEAKRQKLEKEVEEFAKGSKNKKENKKISSELGAALENGGIEAQFETDSVDEEEDYYEDVHGKIPESELGNIQNYEEDESDEDDLEDEDDDRDILQFRDLVRPLEAWGFSLVGKIPAKKPSVRAAKDRSNINHNEDQVMVERVEPGDEEDEESSILADTEKTAPRKKKSTPPKPSSRKDIMTSSEPEK